MAELVLVIHTLTALVFFIAGVGKARHPLALQGVVANYRVLPAFAVKPLAFLLAPVEIAIAAALLSAAPPKGDFAAGGLLALFSLAMAINIRRGRSHIDCGCFQSTLRQPLSWILVARNLGLLLLLGVAALVPERPLSALEAAEALVAGTVLFVIIQSLNVVLQGVPMPPRQRAFRAGDQE